MSCVIHVLQQAESLLLERGIDSPRLSSQLLLAKVLHLSRLDLLLAKEQPLSSAQLQSFNSLLDRRLKGEPVAYLLGTKEFFGLQFLVDSRVLIPRPETEEMIEHLQKLLPPEASFVFADLGTGSGALAVTLASLFPRCCGLAVDISLNALDVARANALLHDTSSRLLFVNTDFLTSFTQESLDLIVTNPPYITEDEYATLSPEVSGFEPRLALVSGPDGLECLRRIELRARAVLKPGGYLFAEIGWLQGPGSRDLFHSWTECTVLHDLSGKDRILCARK